MWNRTWCGVEGGRWEVEAREKSQRESQGQAQTAESGLQPQRIRRAEPSVAPEAPHSALGWAGFASTASSSGVCPATGWD